MTDIKFKTEQKTICPELGAITCWYKYSKSKEIFEFNHIQDNFIKTDKPTQLKPEFTAQNDWVNYIWKKEFCFIRDDGQMSAPVNKIMDLLS